MPVDIVTMTEMVVEDTTKNTNQTSITLLSTEKTTEFTNSGDGSILDFDTTFGQHCK